MKKIKKIVIWGILLLVVIGGGAYYLARDKNAQKNLVTEEVMMGDIDQTVSVTGEVIPELESEVGFEVGGIVDELLFELGDAVEDGQLLAKLENMDVLARVTQSKIDLKISQKELELQRQRYWDTLKPEEKEKYKLAVDKADATLNVAFEDFHKTRLKAPVAGIIAKKYVEKGEVVTISQPVAKIIIQGDLRLEANVPESDIDQIALGQEGIATFDAFPIDETYRVRVDEIEPTSTVIQDVVYYKVKFALLDNNERIKPGMSADIDITTQSKDNVLKVYQRSIVYKNGSKYVRILNEMGEVSEKEITTGLTGDDGTVEVVSGLMKDDIVVIEDNEE